MRKGIMANRKFGLLTVLQTFNNEKGYPVCRCVCECGEEKVVYKSNLLGGRTRSCGCLEEANRRKHIDLRDKRFGQLRVVEPTHERKDGNIVWRCVCDCGAEVLIPGRYLTRGYAKNCGYHPRETTDITNQRFGKLTALYPDKSQQTSRTKWICRCDCGEMCSVFEFNLRNGHTRSCGCLKSLEYRTLIDGTCLEVIASDTVPSNNRSGVKGVSYYSRTDSWVATLNFKGKHYWLGKYDTVDEAARQRQLAEEAIFDPFIEAHSHLLDRKEKQNERCEKSCVKLQSGAEAPARFSEHGNKLG